MDCPFCSKMLFHVTHIPNTPFTGKDKNDPVIHSEANGYYCHCPHCSEKVQLQNIGGAFQLAPNQNTKR